MTRIKLGYCSYKAARYAVMTWHYSKTMPIGKMVRIGVWENEAFIGCVLFGRGANRSSHIKYGIQKTEMCELVRVALSDHTTPVSKIVSISFKLLMKSSPNMRLVYSFADPRQGHIGGIYQAGNWIYAGTTASGVEYFHEGRWKHSREVTSGAFGTNRSLNQRQISILPKRNTEPKHRYLFPLDKKMRKKIANLHMPYPKRRPIQRESEDHSDTGGAGPTPALYTPAAGD